MILSFACHADVDAEFPRLKPPIHETSMSHRLLLPVLALASLVAGCGVNEPAPSPAGVNAAKPVPQTLRCAVVGGLADTGLWQDLGDRFEKQTGHRLEITVRAPKREIAESFVKDKFHVIAVHASDSVINLVADGHAVDPQPFARNDFVLVGPVSDPAGVKGMTDVAEALRKIIDQKAPLMVHSSNGAMEVLRDVMDGAGLGFDAESTIVRLDDRHRQMLMEAGEKGAYTLVGRIPFVNGKIPKKDLEVMVQGDPRLRRPYVVAIAPRNSANEPASAAARQFVAFLRSEETQAWIAEYGRGRYDNQPLFFRVALPVH
jgi:tungstate transport system substrate-binding protein